MGEKGAAPKGRAEVTARPMGASTVGLAGMRDRTEVQTGWSGSKEFAKGMKIPSEHT